MKPSSKVSLTSLALMVGLLMVAWYARAAPLSQNSAAFYPGDLIRGSQMTVYYYGSDGQRYVFPNEKTYFTWYQDFSGVKRVSDEELARLPLGKTNVTYRPGKKLVKVSTDTRVYVIDRGGILRHVLTEELAQTLYGASWRSQVEDIPDEVFANYTEGPPISVASQYIPSDVLTLTTRIDQEKRLPEKIVTINIGSPSVGFTPPTFSIKSGMTVRWVNTDIRQHQIVGGEGWTSPLLNPGESFERTFTEAGSSTYGDLIHRSMEGNLNIIQ